ncbi:MAG: mechanosensitive ion channel [Bdellovibrionota bacterium]
MLLKQLLFIAILGICIVFIIVSLPIDEKCVQLLSLIGIFITAAVALSSTTFLGNLMAGFMLRSINNFAPGDFIEVSHIFGRVSEYGFLHTEVQTEDSNLTTLPNLFLVTHPVKVYRSSGTVISAEVSLGYDVSKERIIEKLTEAAQAIGLESVFVHALNLGDFSITYKVSGFLKEIKSIVSTRSKLRLSMVTKLHEANIEIVSPTFMNQRVYDTSQKFIVKSWLDKAEESQQTNAEDVIFDKAEKLEDIEEIKTKKAEFVENAEIIKKDLAKEKDETEKEKLEKTLHRYQRAIERLNAMIDERSEQLKNEA